MLFHKVIFLIIVPIFFVFNVVALPSFFVVAKEISTRYLFAGFTTLTVGFRAISLFFINIICILLTVFMVVNKNSLKKIKIISK